MVENLNKNLIPFAIIIAALIIAGAIVWATMIYIKGIEKPGRVLEEAGPAAVIQPEEPEKIPPTGEPSLEAFAKCLSQRGMKFYGAFWCHWCNKQKELFGEAAQYLPYIECSDKETGQLTSQCQKAGISGFPTWQLPNGEKFPGFRPLEKLAELSGCQL